MIEFLNNDLEDINDVIIQTANKLEIPEVVVEKDIWVSFILNYLFSKSKYKQYFQFKGGTSLSKAYNVISRFSEDIDIVLNEEAIGVKLESLYEKTRSQRDKMTQEINQLAVSFYEEKVVPEMKEYILKNIKHKISVNLNKEELAIYVKYPTKFDNKYIKNEIKIEIGPISAWTPNDKIKLDSYIFRVYPNIFDEGTYDVLVTKIERTFIEKIVILHKESNRIENYPLRYSRHYYDVFKIYNNFYNKIIKIDDKLIDEVREFHEIFYYRKWANFETAQRGSFKLIPNDKYLEVLNRDYKAMLDMIYKDDLNITFDEIIESIKEVENTLNNV